MSTISRRRFVAASGAAVSGMAIGSAALARQEGPPRAHPTPAPGPKAAGKGGGLPCVIASANGLAATARAMELLRGGADPAAAVVGGVKIMEDDPEDDSVGYGGLPNEDGVVELDASVMHGPTHKSGAVAGLRNIKNPAAVALLVLRRTDHCLIVGDGALRFARAHGFQEENLLTEKSRLEWVKWKENVGKGDNWLGDDQIDRWKSDPKDTPRAGDQANGVKHGLATPNGNGGEGWGGAWAVREARFHTGTVHCAAVDKDGDAGSCTSTSGLSWKLAGRVGDSPIIGAGNYCDNAVGAAGATGRGESTITNLAAFSIVREMESGTEPGEACLRVLKRIVDRTREKRRLDAKGRPDFQVKVYGLRKDGVYGAASLYKGEQVAVCDAGGARKIDIPWLFEREPAR